MVLAPVWIKLGLARCLKTHEGIRLKVPLNAKVIFRIFNLFPFSLISAVTRPWHLLCVATSSLKFFSALDVYLTRRKAHSTLIIIVRIMFWVEYARSLF